jgi:hypothetical protein
LKLGRRPGVPNRGQSPDRGAVHAPGVRSASVRSLVATQPSPLPVTVSIVLAAAPSLPMESRNDTWAPWAAQGPEPSGGSMRTWRAQSPEFAGISTSFLDGLRRVAERVDPANGPVLGRALVLPAGV